jgi:hypothetical protein
VAGVSGSGESRGESESSEGGFGGEVDGVLYGV